MDVELIDRLRSDLTEASYTLPNIRALLGDEAEAARERGVLTPALRILASLDASALQILSRCFLFGETVTETEINRAFPRLSAEGAVTLGLIAQAGAQQAPQLGFTAALSLNPVSIEDSIRDEPLHWWLISDLDDHLRRAPAAANHVMGVGGATRSLIAQAPADTVTRALDLGTGCGAVALHLALRGPVIATDISERALTFAHANARLNGVTGIEFRLGNLFKPVAGESFDLILSNPPFVVTPRSIDTTYEYRDAGMIGDALAELVIRDAPEHLLEDGMLLCLANWESSWGIDGGSRVTEWIDRAAAHAHLAPAALASWVIERDRVSPIRYAETWARDGGAKPGEGAFDTLVSQWIEDFTARQIVALGLGSIRVRRLATDRIPSQPIRQSERASGIFAQRPGAALDAAFTAGIETACMSSETVLAHHWYLDPGVREERTHQPGIEAPQAIALVSVAGIERRVVADPLLAAAVGACDGYLTLGQIADALATLLDVDAAAAAEALVVGIRELVWMGMLTPWPPIPVG